jgi:type IV pilus assembly protein PilX
VQRGIALVFVLIMMSIATAIALIAARVTLLSDRGSRNDRDRQVAQQSAELALQDARDDIMSPAMPRGCQFGTVLMAKAPGCQSDSATRGLCGPNDVLANKPIYKDVNWEDTSTGRAYVNYGEFTGRVNTLQVGSFGAPAKAPKYIILDESETMSFQMEKVEASGARVMVPISRSSDPASPLRQLHSFRVFALGYGTSPDVQVMLETVILKPQLASQCS